MERSRHASHLASRSYHGGIPDLGGGDEVAGAEAGAGGGGVGAAVSGASAMARVSRREETGRRDSGEGGAEGRTGRDSGAARVWVARALQRTESERERRKGKETSWSDRSLGKKTVDDRRSGIGAR